ncbi:MAG: Gfo/Idh/MocA family oxidoreductase [Alphaproteobacteria bacterium]
MNTAPFTVGIIGLGRIACGLDRPDGPEAHTHLKACLADGRFHIVALSDVDIDHAHSVAKIWVPDAEVIPPDDFVRRRFDAVCVATPDETHASILEALAHTTPSVVMCEKPLAGSAREAEAVVARLEAQKVAVAVNHSRRFAPGVGDWLARARSGEFGKPISGRLRYTRGLRHNGVHGFDLISACLPGGIVCGKRMNGRIADFSADDPTVSGLVVLSAPHGDVPLWIDGIDGRMLTAFEVEILFEKGRLVAEDCDGTTVRTDVPTPLPAPFAPELRTDTIYRDHPARLMTFAWRNLGDHLERGADLVCSGREAVRTLAFVEEVVRCLA